jgi:chemotaxis protein histidine kinase CheA
MSDTNEEIINRAKKLFVLELARHRSELSDMLKLVTQPEQIHASFVNFAELERRFHTIKGGAGFFGYSECGELASFLEHASFIFRKKELKTSDCVYILNEREYFEKITTFVRLIDEIVSIPV